MENYINKSNNLFINYNKYNIVDNDIINEIISDIDNMPKKRMCELYEIISSIDQIKKELIKYEFYNIQYKGVYINEEENIYIKIEEIFNRYHKYLNTTFEDINFIFEKYDETKINIFDINNDEFIYYNTISYNESIDIKYIEQYKKIFNDILKENSIKCNYNIIMNEKCGIIIIIFRFKQY